MTESLAGYRFSPGEASVFVEIYLPKKSRFQAELYAALNDGFRIEKVKEHLTDREADVRELMQNYYLYEYHDDVVLNMPPVLRGYSIYEVDGFFFNESTQQIDEERTQVVRIMFRPPVLSSLPSDEDGRLKRRVVREYLRSTGSREEFGASFVPRLKIERREVGQSLELGGARHEAYTKLVMELRNWECQVALLIFGYVIFRICEKIKVLKTTTGITEEEEIWVTSLWNLVVNRVVAVKADEPAP